MENNDNVMPETTLQQPTSIFEVFETDEVLETQGVDFYFGPGAGTWKIAYAGDQTFQSALAERMKPFSHAQSQGLLDPKISQDILCETYGEFLVKGFTDVIGKDGNEIQFSTLEAIRLLKQLKHLFKLVREASLNFANYRKIYAEVVSKKS